MKNISKVKAMPDIYTYFGFIFSFFSQEHEPIHVHVEHQDRMTIFDLIIVDGELIEIKKRDILQRRVRSSLQLPTDRLQ